ncbi:MAG: insulinase family protein [Thermoleophilia bacterium]|nr:insulinase family protein [Thermoleophilia bacterium]
MIHARFLDEHLEDALAVMADMVIHPTFAEADLEREVVAEEINMYEDSPSELIADNLTEAIFDGHPLGKSVLGTMEVIESVTLDQVRSYHQSHYRLPNMVVAAAGNVEHDELTELASVYLATGNGARAEAPGTGELPAATSAAARFTRKETQQYHVSFGGLGVHRQDERRFALSILDGILGGSASSRLFQEVRDKRGLAYSVYSYSTAYSDSGLIGVYFGSRAESVGEITRIVVNQLRSIMEDGVTEKELHRAKENAKGRLVLGMETTHNRMSRLGKLSVTDAAILDLDELIARVEAVTAAEVKDLARELYQPDRLTAVGIGPDAGVFEEAMEILGGERLLTVKEA